MMTSTVRTFTGQSSVSRSKVKEDISGMVSSRAVRTSRKRKRDAELQEDQQRLKDRPSTSAPSADTAPEEPLSIHGRTVKDFQDIYHSTVDPMLRMPSGRLRPYSLGLGLRIKQRLWETLNRPSFCEEEQADGSIRIREIFSTPGTAAPPRIEVDISGEPPPHRPR